jgi:hypothetical protein
VKLGNGWTYPDDVRLPKQVVCVRCGATNAVEIDNAVIAGPLDLKHATFEGEVSLTNTEFTGKVNFTGTSFGQGMRLDGSRFIEPVSCRAAQVHGDFSATNSVFEEQVVEYDLRVNLVMDASHATFAATAFCRRLDLVKAIIFRGATFNNDAIFSNSRVGGNATFDDVHFNGE